MAMEHITLGYVEFCVKFGSVEIALVKNEAQKEDRRFSLYIGDYEDEAKEFQLSAEDVQALGHLFRGAL